MAFTCLNPDQAVKVEVSYLQPTFTVSYLDINICAAVTFPDILAVDIVTPTDLVTLATTKALSDTTDGFSDAATRSFTKGSSDSVTMTDDIDIDFFLQKFLLENQALTDAKAYQLVKPFLESITPADADQISFVKQLADVVNAPTDTVVTAIQKSLADSVTLTDVAQAFKLFIRDFSDSVSTPDLAALDVQPGQESDSAAVSDNETLVVDKAFSEGLNLLDNMDGDIEYVFIKLVSELLVASDAQAVDFASNKSDNAVLSSSGILSMQDYCDITYFLEDYVGVSRTFT